MNEQWQRWNPPHITVERHYFIDYVSLNSQSVAITVCNADDLSRLITFTFKAIAYRYTDETYRLETISSIDHLQGGIYAKWSFFTVANSTYLAELHVSHHLYTHYIFVTSDAIVDIVGTQNPSVTCITKDYHE